MIVVIPSAGDDEAFKRENYPFCKNLAEIQGKPLVQHVWENLQCLEAREYVFVIRKEDDLRYRLGDVRRLMDRRAVGIKTEAPTRGAACTALLAIDHIVADEELVITNGDQILATDLAAVIDDFRQRDLDGGVVVFDSVHPRWSFVRVDRAGMVIETAEKRPISRLATAGFYYFRRGADFVEAACAMVRKDAHVNGQFYVCPAFNEMILRGGRIGVAKIEREAYLSLATPQNVEEYEQRLTSLRGRPA